VLRRVVLGCSLIASPLDASPLAAQPADTTAVSADPLFVRRDAYYAAGFMVATLAAAPLDRHFAERLQRPWVQENRFLARTAAVFRFVGGPGAYIIGASLYGAGRAFDNARMADLGLHGTEALVIGHLTGLVLKGTFGRARPHVSEDDPDPFQFKLGRGFFRGEDYRSFPSGHSVGGFAAAAVAVTEAKRWWPEANWAVAPIMYGGAALIGISRMYNNKHWASDVITGALIGSFAGRKIVRYHHSHPANRIDDWLLAGSISPGDNGAFVFRVSLLPGVISPMRR
jgi:membrane-associated phospholipid phosphatase